MDTFGQELHADFGDDNSQVDGGHEHDSGSPHEPASGDDYVLGGGDLAGSALDPMDHLDDPGAFSAPDDGGVGGMPPEPHFGMSTTGDATQDGHATEWSTADAAGGERIDKVTGDTVDAWK